MNPATTLLSQEYGKQAQTVTMTRTYKVPTGHIIRVAVTNNAYRDQSSARADVLSPGLTWTALTYEPAESWYEANVPSMYKRGAEEALETGMQELCDLLADRAAFILDAACGPTGDPGDLMITQPARPTTIQGC